jgi:hypothetical protein
VKGPGARAVEASDFVPFAKFLHIGATIAIFLMVVKPLA